MYLTLLKVEFWQLSEFYNKISLLEKQCNLKHLIILQVI